jgi:PAS domain-containing protein
MSTRTRCRRPANLLAINSDITARKRAETALRESEEQFRSMVQGVQDYALLRLTEDGHITT